MATKIKPLHDKVLLERVESQDKTSGGILLPDTAKEKPTEGRVVAVGDGRRNDEGVRVPLEVKTGDRVLFGSFAGTSIREAGTEYLILDASELLAVVDDVPWSSASKGGSSAKAAPSKSAPAKTAPKKKK